MPTAWSSEVSDASGTARNLPLQEQLPWEAMSPAPQPGDGCPEQRDLGQSLSMSSIHTTASDSGGARRRPASQSSAGGGVAAEHTHPGPGDGQQAGPASGDSSTVTHDAGGTGVPNITKDRDRHRHDRCVLSSRKGVLPSAGRECQGAAVLDGAVGRHFPAASTTGVAAGRAIRRCVGDKHDSAQQGGHAYPRDVGAEGGGNPNLGNRGGQDFGLNPEEGSEPVREVEDPGLHGVCDTAQGMPPHYRGSLFDSCTKTICADEDKAGVEAALLQATYDLELGGEPLTGEFS
eukprot:CAMPEP_0179020820 /NCGR_PEP_ID=MMETSP0796-20121207/5572_1 /TAXON_ID=73915 /ORGANISM="Pyrodinium bahamense, Strain pbaha01" /LENGTH=289 /DNA_ID=CAMNT_0020716633 /DNA_START=60 /DNA_END=928 /DNA_ORIENTATION=-